LPTPEKNFTMCNNTALSNFLDGVNFEDPVMSMDLEIFENDLLAEEGFLNMLDIDTADSTGMDVIDTAMDFLTSDVHPLPPLELGVATMQHDEDLDALLSPPEESEFVDAPLDTPVISTKASLEKLAQCMRTSEMELAMAQKNFNLQASQSRIFFKANPFFTGCRATITPELEMSRQNVWNLIRSHSQAQQQQLCTHTQSNATAAA
jgi:hypothetical protein